MNSLPLSGPSLRASTLPPCISASFWTMVSPMPSPPSDRASERSPWAKSLNISGSFSGGMPDPVVPDADDDLLALPLRGEPDPAAALGVLRGVGQQVQDDLLDPRRVDVERQLAPLDRDAEGVPPLVDERPGRLDRLVEDRARVHEVLPEPDLPARDARDVEQVVDEPDELPDLPLDDVAGPVAALLVGGHLEDGHGVVDRGERVAQLVGEHRQELVLVAVVLAEGLGLPLPLGEVLPPRVLAAPVAEGRLDGARQRPDLDGPPHERHVPDRFQLPGRRRRLVGRRQDDEREVGPGGLLLQEPGEASLLVVEDGLVGDDGDGRPPLDLGADLDDVLAEGEGDPHRLEDLRGRGGVPLRRGEEEDSLLELGGRLVTHCSDLASGPFGPR